MLNLVRLIGNLPLKMIGSNLSDFIPQFFLDKLLAAVDETKRVLILSQAREGKVLDKRLHDEDDIAASVPDEIPIEVDLGFLGLQKEYDNLHLLHKKPKGGQLSEIQKRENRTLSQSRVICKNAFAGVKHYSAVSGVYRNRTEEFDNHLMLTAAGRSAKARVNKTTGIGKPVSAGGFN